MELIQEYLENIFSPPMEVKELPRERIKMLPIYLRETYWYYSVTILGKAVVLVEPKYQKEFKILRTRVQLNKLPKEFGIIVLLLREVTAINRNRMVQSRINFIVPGKQLFLPELLMDLRESYPAATVKKSTDHLTPSAQAILLYHILPYNKWDVETHSFKELAEKFGYTPMSISKAVDNLKMHELIKVEGEKEKFVRFNMAKHELWNHLLKTKIWTNPVLKTVYVEKKPAVATLRANITGLAQYSEINESNQKYYAIDKVNYYALQQKMEIDEIEDTETKYCLEVWKYDPLILAENTDSDQPAVDPLSLYLSMQENTDERVDIELDNIIEKYTW